MLAQKGMWKGLTVFWTTPIFTWQTRVYWGCHYLEVIWQHRAGCSYSWHGARSQQQEALISLIPAAKNFLSPQLYIAYKCSFHLIIPWRWLSTVGQRCTAAPTGTAAALQWGCEESCPGAAPEERCCSVSCFSFCKYAAEQEGCWPALHWAEPAVPSLAGTWSHCMSHRMAAALKVCRALSWSVLSSEHTVLNFRTQ